MVPAATFGYGSLVNAATVSADTVLHSASIRGWRRAWRHSGTAKWGKRCTLTVIPDPASQIMGVILVQNADTLGSLNQREGDYDRVVLPVKNVNWIEAAPEQNLEISIYVGRERHRRSGDHEHPVFLSYLDTVLQGYRRRYGDDGIQHFLETTLDWHVPIIDDRSAPRYPRHTGLSPQERSAIDRHLMQLKIEVKPALIDQRS